MVDKATDIPDTAAPAAKVAVDTGRLHKKAKSLPNAKGRQMRE